MAGRIEFLDAGPSEPGPDDAVVQPPPRQTGRRNAAFVAAGLLIGGAIVARVATAGSAEHAPPVARSVAPSPVAPTPSVTDVRPLPGFDTYLAGPISGRDYPGASRCPEGDDGQSACVATTTLPRAVLAAVRSSFPRAQHLSSFTEVTRQTHLIWSRYIRFDVGGSAIQIYVEQPGVLELVSGVSPLGKGEMVTASERAAGTVRVIQSISGGAPLSPPVDPVTVQAFVRDERLADL